MQPSIRLLLIPGILMAAIATMYVLSLVPGEPLNRADMAFGLMGLAAAWHAFLAYGWYKKGYITFLLLKELEEKTISTLTELHERATKSKDTIAESVASPIPDGTASKLIDIINKNKS